jgi:DNA polymerase-1
MRDPTAEDRVKEAVKRREAAKPETPDEAFQRIGAMSLTDRERQAFGAFKQAFISGEIGNPRSDNAKWTKADVVSAGMAILRKKAEGEREKRIAETLRTKPSNFHVITDDAELPKMVDRLREEVRRQQRDPWFRKVFGLFNNTLIRRKIDIPAAMSLTVWDTETSGLDKMIDLSGGYSVWLPILNEGYYVAYGHLTGERQCTRSKALTAIERFMALPEHIKSFHNAEYDLSILLNDGLRPQGVRYDSQAAQRILNEHEESFGLKPLVAKYKSLIGIDVDDYTFEDLFGSESPMLKPIEVVGVYAIKDVWKGWALTKWQIDTMVATDSLYVPFFEIRQYLTEINVNIERTGFVIDLPGLKRLGDEYRPRLEKAKRDLITAYNIDDSFLYDMSMALKGDKIHDWCDKQAQRIAKRDEMLARCKAELAGANPTTKKYAQLAERIQRYESEELADPIPQNAPDFIREFNLSSNDHVAYLIYDRLGIKDRTKEIVKDKSRERAVSKDVLERYFAEEESLAPLAEVSKFEKLLGTYVDKIPHALDVDGRLHTQLDTVSTGRYSSKGYTGKPNDVRPDTVTDETYLDVMRRLVETAEKSVEKGTNIQNIPSRNDEGLRVRMMFIPPPGHVFMGSDLSAIEPRLQAHIMSVEFGDDIFAEIFRKGLDPYVEFASMLFDVPKEHCFEDYYKSVKGTSQAVPPYRKLMKQLFLAEGYGQAFEQFYKSVQPFGITEEHALRAYRKFDEVLPGFKRMVESAFEHLREHGWTATLWHQKRRFPRYIENWKRLCALMKKAGIRDKNDPELGKKSRRLHPKERTEFWSLIRETGRDERAAFNHTIQGSGANVLQLCMIRSYYECTLGRGWEFPLTLHDEQKHALPIAELTPEAVALYDDIMTQTVTLACPLKCDTVIETRWMCEFSREEWDYAAGRPLPEFADKYGKYGLGV